MASVFARTGGTFESAFAADRATMSVDDGGVARGTTALVQRLAGQFSQKITRLYDVSGSGSKTRVYDVGGRAAGHASMARAIGSSQFMAAFHRAFGDAGRVADNDLSLRFRSMSGGADRRAAGAGSPAPKGMYDMKSCLLTQAGAIVQVGDVAVSESSALMFNDLHFTETG